MSKTFSLLRTSQPAIFLNARLALPARLTPQKQLISGPSMNAPLYAFRHFAKAAPATKSQLELLLEDDTLCAASTVSHMLDSFMQDDPKDPEKAMQVLRRISTSIPLNVRDPFYLR